MPLNKIDIKGLDQEQLINKLKESKLVYNREVLNHTISPLPNPSSLRFMRKDIARIKTAISLLNNKK